MTPIRFIVTFDVTDLTVKSPPVRESLKTTLRSLLSHTLVDRIPDDPEMPQGTAMFCKVMEPVVEPCNDPPLTEFSHDADPVRCPFCGGSHVQFINGWPGMTSSQVPNSDTVDMNEWQCRGVCEGRSFWV